MDWNYQEKKTCLMLFNNGKNPLTLPQLNIDGIMLLYKQEVKFLGVYLTKKLNWNVHIQKLISSARRRVNLLKIISAQPWSQDTNTLIHLAISLIRSKLIYGQEVYFSASSTLLKKLQSIDSKAIKIALGVPTHTNTLNTYKEAHILPLSEQRKVAVSKYVIRSMAVPNFVQNEIFITRQNDYPKRAQNIPSLEPVFNYIQDVLEENNIDITMIPRLPLVPQMPPWEHMQATFDTDYTNIKKDEDQNLLSVEVKNHIESQYANHLKVFTDGSVLETGECGAAFVIPTLKIQKSFHLGRGFSIFTSELLAILMALNYLSAISLGIYNIVFCVDSKSVLLAMKHWHCKVRNDIIFEIKFLIHCIMSKGIGVHFCWIPSHCGLHWNELTDHLAKRGASEYNTEILNSNLRLSSYEVNSIISNSVCSKFLRANYERLFCSRNQEMIIHKLRLNSWNTKFSKNIQCCCSNAISVHHILFDCPVLTVLYENKGVDIRSKYSNIEEVLFDSQQDLTLIINIISHSPVGRLL